MSIRTEKTKTASSAANEDLREEDGWLFRERPGIPVECVGRATKPQGAEMTPPNQIRHNYPSA